MKPLGALLGLGAILCTAGAVIAADAGSAAPMSAVSVAGGVNRFAFDLYGRLRSQEQGNLFFSPQSISTALAMTYAGARGETADEMARTMHFPVPPDRLPAGYAELLRALHGGEGTKQYRLAIANRLWGQQGTAFLEAFLAVTRRDYGAEMGLADFATNAEGARQEINGWVAQQTEQKIGNLIPAGVLGPDTRLVLANAIYFRGNWAHQFEKSATQDRPFHVSARTTVDVPLMFSEMSVGYAAQPDAALKVVELPYQGDDLSMLVLLPDASDGLSDVEAKLTAENVGRWTSGLARRDVLVYLPRFSVESGFGLGSTLAAMGMPAPFSERADFSGMNGKRDLSISAVLHRARVDVDEQGTEAAAATGVAVGVRAMRPQEPPTFRADHPFAFFIRNNPTGTILFLGRVTNPKA
jgi:serine protease inhibitor